MGKFTTLVLIIIAFALGIYVGRMPITSLILDNIGPTTQKTTESSASGSVTKKTTGVTTISTAKLSAEQRSLLSALGINADNIVVTQEMITCAEAKLGAARIDEIAGGAKVTFTEGLSLLACYK